MNIVPAESQTKTMSIDEYISAAPAEVRPMLQDLRETILRAAPQATETISYGMPAFRAHGILVYFAACKGHIGFYPTAAPMEAFKTELAEFKTSKGAIQFPLDKPMPTELVERIVRFRVEQDQEKALARSNRPQ